MIDPNTILRKKENDVEPSTPEYVKCIKHTHL